MMEQTFMNHEDELTRTKQERDNLADQLAKLLIREREKKNVISHIDMSLNDIMLEQGLTQEEIDEPETLWDDITKQPKWWKNMNDIQKREYLDTEIDNYNGDAPVLV